MEEFLREASTTYWWIIFIIVPGIVTFIMYFVTKGVDTFGGRLLGSVSKKMKERNLRKQKEREELVEYLVNHPESIIQYRFDEISTLQWALTAMTISLFSLIISLLANFVFEHVFAATLFIAISWAFIIFYILWKNRSDNYRKALLIADRTLRKIEEEKEEAKEEEIPF